MRVVLDTNVLMSGIFFAGPPARILAAWAEGRFDLLATVEVLTEYRRVANRLAKQYPSIEIDPVLDLIIRECRIVEPFPLPMEACDNADDVKFLSCAISGRATCVVSGDRALRFEPTSEGLGSRSSRKLQLSRVWGLAPTKVGVASTRCRNRSRGRLAGQGHRIIS